MVKAATPLPALIRLARPKQWIKNLLVVGAAFAAGALGHNDAWVKVGVAFLSFCLLASGIYALNDVRDRHEDREHPTKCRRPVASGAVSPRLAGLAGAAWIVAGLLLSSLDSPVLTLTAEGYVIVTLSYTLIWRHVVVMDILAIAAGFVLRAVAGGAAIGVPLSTSFLLVVTFAAIMIAAGKRDSELSRARGDLGNRRLVLRLYTHRTLGWVLIAALCGAILAYVAWALEQRAGVTFPWRLITAVPFSVALLRYLQLVRRGQTEAPDELLLRDWPMLCAAGLWLISFGLGVNAGA
ncbi:decaprenyl-phosphate phosphoribosyltransferase [Conexibacter sp. DBS9H8]|uniref:decaprenyl-phosphate phosphoribosyltransferase n=1 Tax=Conexibacter sp. DBS9H8 TaxID=2937801 RepID=UPI0020103330|nr:decaprenyl-phosphate phosphoribosyltransferase [Conexibacter sp. DBS9H8]